MKEKYIPAEMKVVTLQKCDIITTSWPFIPYVFDNTDLEEQSYDAVPMWDDPSF